MTANTRREAPVWLFKIPSLPPGVYNWGRAFRDRHQLSWWHVVIAGIKALETLETQNEVEKCLEWAKRY